MSEYRTPPKHPRTLRGPAREAYLQRERERSSLACLSAPEPGKTYRLRVDYGDAYALFVRGTVKRAPSMIRYVDFTYSSALEYTGGGSDLLGTVQIAGGRVQATIKIGLSCGKPIRQVRVGAADDCGGMFEDWFIGQVGDLTQARPLAPRLDQDRSD